MINIYARIVIIGLLFTNLFTVGILYVLAERTPKPTRLILNAAHRSYFVACMDSFTFAGFPKDDSLVVCKQNANDYLQELCNAIGEEFPGAN